MTILIAALDSRHSSKYLGYNKGLYEGMMALKLESRSERSQTNGI